MLKVANAPATFAPRRALFADSLVAATLLVNAANRLAERLDNALYPAHLSQPLGKPVYIVAAPRSGTTFLHRLMSEDPQFTTFKLLQTFFPTVTGHRALNALGALNQAAGGLFTKLQERLDDEYFGAWEGLHDMGLNEDEEDEALWALAFATPAIWLVLPFPERFDHLRFVDKLPPKKRAKLVEHYRGCVQRHLYASQGKTLLGKNVLLPGRFEIVTEALPEARFVHILRHPYEAVPSSLSLFTVPWKWHSPKLSLRGGEAHALGQLIIDYYKFLHQKQLESDRAGDHRFFSMTYKSLLQDPVKRIEEIYERFSLPMTSGLRARLQAEAAKRGKFKSEHTYSLEQFGLTKDYVYSELGDLFDYYGFER
ncbi:MAG TPA: sulfotransferase [Polyangiales bacterium]|nr:sulfotransferase [Polyangiales bacterium]